MSRVLEEHWLLHFNSKTTLRYGLSRNRMDVLELRAGTLVVPHRNTQEWISHEQAADFLAFRVRDHAVQAAAQEVLKPSQEMLPARIGWEDARLSGLLSAIEAEQRLGFPGGQLVMDSLEHALILVLLQDKAGGMRQRRSGKHPGLAPFRRKRVLELIASRIEKPPSLQELASVAGLSLSHFTGMFRQSMGMSPHQYVMRQRVAYARRLLRDPRHRVIDVAALCGFATQQHFTWVFRRVTGETPRAYRQRI